MNAAYLVASGAVPAFALGWFSRDMFNLIRSRGKR